MLKKFDMDKAKPIKTPMPTNGHLDLDQGGKDVDQKVYRSMMCARFQANLKECHLMAVKRIF
jgi:hypothetical protein